jgi:hypothetical protein
MHLLNYKCFVCNKLRASDSVIVRYTKVFDYIEQGDLDAASKAEFEVSSLF